MLEVLNYMILTGDFPGRTIAGVEEDHPIVSFALALHNLFFG